MSNPKNNVLDLTWKFRKEDEWFNAFALCMLCNHRWVATVEISVSIFKLQCPSCGGQESFGSIVPDEYMKAMTRKYPPEEDADGNS
jgi:transcription elongation factor Elf1